MINRYIIFERYEYINQRGKTFTNWFICPLTHFYKNENIAKEYLKKIIGDSNICDKKTKLKHEYEIRKIDIETLSHPKVIHGHKGRPSKQLKEKIEYETNNYWKLHVDEYTI